MTRTISSGPVAGDGLREQLAGPERDERHREDQEGEGEIVTHVLRREAVLLRPPFPGVEGELDPGQDHGDQDAGAEVAAPASKSRRRRSAWRSHQGAGGDPDAGEKKESAAIPAGMRAPTATP